MLTHIIITYFFILIQALVHDSDDIIPKVVDAIKSVETVEGNGGPGTIKKLTFVEG